MSVDTQLRIGLSSAPSNIDDLENQLFVGHNFYNTPKHTVRKMMGPMISLNTNGANGIDEVAQLAAVTNTKIICIQDHKGGVNKIKAIKKRAKHAWGGGESISAAASYGNWIGKGKRVGGTLTLVHPSLSPYAIEKC
jgi:hypothetical protein